MNKLFLALLLALVLLCAAGCACAENRLLLPADTRTIQAQAFYRTAELDTAVLPEGLETIGAKAFAQSSLTSVNLPASLTSIAADAFDGCTGLHMTVISGTPGEAYAIAHGIDYTLLPNGPEDTGVYTFINQKTSNYLAWRGRELYLSPTPMPWTLQIVTDGAFNVSAGETGLVMDIDNAYVAVGTTIKIWEPTGYDVQVWNLTRNSNGTYSFLYSGDNRYCLGFENGKAVLQLRKSGNTAQEWRMGSVSIAAPWQYLSVMGRRQLVELRLPMNVLSVITQSRLQQWANDLETAYASFCDLTQYVPHSDIIVEAYKPCEYAGWVMYGSNIIHIDNSFILGDLKKMAARPCDWNFCALHEMGHMFDLGRPWNFETECLTDLKLAYVLEQYNAAASPSEFAAGDLFYGANIIDAYYILGEDFSQEYSIFGLTARFLEIKADIGWQPFKDTFSYLQTYEDYYADTTPSERLEIFVDLLSQYSGVYIRNYFTNAEWYTMLNACH